MAYYGLMRIGELATGGHPVLAKDVHVNKQQLKLKLYLHTSKTHSKGTRPQEIKIQGRNLTAATIARMKSHGISCRLEGTTLH